MFHRQFQQAAHARCDNHIRGVGIGWKHRAVGKIGHDNDPLIMMVGQSAGCCNAYGNIRLPLIIAAKYVSQAISSVLFSRSFAECVKRDYVSPGDAFAFVSATLPVSTKVGAGWR